jgi:hypothetical protein
MRGFVGVLLMSMFCVVASAEEAPPSQLMVSAAEIAAVEARVEARIEAYRTGACVRPVLRGVDREGSGSEALATMAEGRHPWYRCFSFIEANIEAMPDKDFEAFVETGEGISAGFTAALMEGCGDLPAGVSAIVSHGDVCSPWRPGAERNLEFFPFLRSSKVAVVMGRTAYSPAVCSELVWSALDRIRFDQDIYRGGGTLIAAMVSSASMTRYQSPWLRWLLDRGDLDAGELSDVIDALGTLLTTEPPVGHIIEAEGYWGFLQLASPVKRNEEAILLVAMEEIQRSQAAACPRDATMVECADGLRRHGEEMMRRAEVGTAVRIIRVVASEDPGRAVRQWIVDILAGIAVPNYREYVEKVAYRSILIAAHRLHVAVLKSWRTTGGCPETLEGEAWAALLTDPVIGGALKVRRDTSTQEWIVGPAEELSTESTGDSIEYRFSCPPRSAD